MSGYYGGRGRGRNYSNGRYANGRGGGGGRNSFARRGFASNLRAADDGFHAVSDPAAKPPEGSVSDESPAFKESLTRTCTLKFKGVPQHEVDKWYKMYRKYWPSPNGGFKGAHVTVFWDIENCRPDPDYAPLPINYAEMLRDAFKSTTEARAMRCIASLSKTYPATRPGAARRPGDDRLGYDQLTALNAQAGYMYIMTAPGKWNERVHKDVREVDDQLKCKMTTFLSECSAGDVAVLIAGDHGYVPFCLEAKGKGVNVIVIGPSLAGTNGALMYAADLWMDWPTFATFQGREQRQIPTQMSPQVEARTESIMRDHQEHYSFVKELDMVILLDTTYSMAPYIQGVRDNIGSVLEQISVSVPIRCWIHCYVRGRQLGR
ncbi:hypothetical protein Agub_g3738 [Astrephomene gubernaculifera]|uniref:NYN domain-containing protein n=1 Tax=Astrephomene gubernaculifera TaxID=47775 RepID=A0AAD3DJ37_9CHLO|nr:hypothetical protein Agub_g3738 [Astrephomene gubernaculifera]